MLAIALVAPSLCATAGAHTIRSAKFGFAAKHKRAHPAKVRNPAKLRASASSTATVRVADSQVKFVIDPSYEGGPALQRVSGTLASLVHRSEMNRLTVHIAESSTLNQVCGAGSTACYHPGSGTIIVSGEAENTNNSMPPEMVIAHEYGHHIEANRSDEDWSATHLGGRHWGSYERVCEGVRSGRLYPGTGGFRYWDQPGEAFAQSYAFLHFPSAVPWWWSFAEPDQGAYEAIRADIADTGGSTGAKWARRLNPGRSRASTTVSTPLDGRLRAKLIQPRSGRFELILRSADGGILTRARSKPYSGKGSPERLNYEVCGARSLQLEVRRRSGTGKFKVKIQRP